MYLKYLKSMALIIIWISLEQYFFLNSDSLLDPLVELLMSHIWRQKKHLSTINTPIPILKFAIQFTVSFLEEVTVDLTYSLSSVAIRQLHQVFKASSQSALTCSKLTKEALEQGSKYVQTTPMAWFWCLYC